MKTSEQRLWKTLQKPWSRFGKFTRIESPSTEPGIPDVYGVVQGISVWIELKVVDGLVVPLRPDQVAWLVGHAMYGGLGYVVARKKQEIRIWNGDDSRYIVKPGGWKDVPPIGSWSPPYDHRDMLRKVFFPKKPSASNNV